MQDIEEAMAIMRIDRHETGEGPEHAGRHVPCCPRCGLCPDCRDELRDELHRDNGLEQAMSVRAYARGINRGFAIGGFCGLIVAFLFWAGKAKGWF